MINAEYIGKRIRQLRREKGISQERMAEELGMYQADISNLERAMNGSGIQDLFKLDSIADYFGISLIELIAAPEGEPSREGAPEKNERDEPADCAVVNVRFDDEDNDFCVSLLELAAPDGSPLFIGYDDAEEEPRFYRSAADLWDALHGSGKLPRPFLSGSDYGDLFAKIPDAWLGACRCLIFLATEDAESAALLAQRMKGHKLGAVQAPVPMCEPEQLFNVDYSDLAAVYRLRLMVETDVKNPMFLSEVDDILDREKRLLKKLKEACASEEAYKVWKKDLIEEKLRSVEGRIDFITCTYLIAGMGTYSDTMPKSWKEGFMRWIDGNGSAFYAGERPATKREKRAFIARHIADDDLGLGTFRE